MNLTDSFTSGPIIACQDAINHYDKTIAVDEAELKKLLKRADGVHDNLIMLRAMRDGWIEAKKTLIAKEADQII